MDSENHLWVIDYGNHRGQVSTADGDFLYFFGEDFIGNPNLVGWPKGDEAMENTPQ